MNKEMEMMLRRKNMIYVPGDNYNVPDELLRGSTISHIQTMSDEVKMYVTALNYNMMQLGYKLSESAFNRLCQCDISELDQIYKDTIDGLKELKGANVEYHAMWPNFPKEVMEMDELNLYFNAFIHYISNGTLVPDEEENEKLPSIDFVTPKEISVGNKDDIEVLIKTLLNQSIAYSQRDKEDLTYLMSNYEWKNKLPEKYINKENLATTALIAKDIDKKNLYAFTEKIQTATDVLRIIVGMSDGDVSLKNADKVKFKKNNTMEIKTFLRWLNKCNNLEEDIARNESIWKKVFYPWHPGEYDMSNAGYIKKLENAEKKHKTYVPKISRKDYQKNYENIIIAINKLNNGDLPRSFVSRVNMAMEANDYETAAKILATRPGEMVRQLDNLLRNADDKSKVLEIFEKVASKAAPTALCSALSHFKAEDKPLRVFFPKGSTANSFVKEDTREPLDSETTKKAINIMQNALGEIYKEKQNYGKIYVAEDIKKYKAPMVLRNTSKTGRSIPRGSVLPMDSNGEKTNNVIRGFLWWTNKGNTRVDIDLSATVFDKDWKPIDEITYYNLKGKYGCHSGDFTNGGEENGKGVAEFVDIDMKAYQEIGGKYVVFTAHNFTQYSFDETPCKFGWMERELVNDRKIFEPKTVKEAAELNCKATICVPVIMDLENKEIIWADMTMKDTEFRANNVANTLNQSIATCYAVVNNEFTDLMDLIDINTKERGEYTEDPREADIIICENPEKINEIIEQLNKEDEFEEELKETTKIISVNDTSAINAIFINPDTEIDKELLPKLEQEEISLDDMIESKKEGLSGIVSMIQGEQEI